MRRLASSTFSLRPTIYLDELVFFRGTWPALAYRNPRFLSRSLPLLARVLSIVTIIRKVDFDTEYFAELVDT